MPTETTPLQRIRAAFTRIDEGFREAVWTFDELTGDQQDAWNDLAQALADAESALVPPKPELVIGDGYVSVTNMTLTEVEAAMAQWNATHTQDPQFKDALWLQTHDTTTFATQHTTRRQRQVDPRMVPRTNTRPATRRAEILAAQVQHH
jgi:hypothetical protein